MTPRPFDPSAPASERRADGAMTGDLRALEHATAHDSPTLDSTLRTLRPLRARPISTWEAFTMSSFDNLKQRPWLATGLVAAAVMIALLVFPISYERTTGHAVALTVSGPALGTEQLLGIAKQLEQTLGVERVAAQATADGGAPKFVLTATVPSRSGAHTASAIRAFEGELEKLGYAVSSTVTPVKERVSGNVYAYARDQVIEINMDGKSAPQLENEIRQRLAEAGITNATVSVTDRGTGDQKKLEVKVEAHAQHPAGTSATEEHPMPGIVFTKNGAPLGDSKGVTMRVEKRKTETGTTMVITVTKDGRNTTAEIPNADTMSDADLAAALQKQMDAAGVPVVVTVTDGHIGVESKDGK
jgi:citrate lyase gamma subunit